MYHYLLSISPHKKLRANRADEPGRISQTMTLFVIEIVTDTELTGRLLSVAFTNTSIYVVFIVFLLDKYVQLESKKAQTANLFYYGTFVVLGAFALSFVATVGLMFVTLGLIDSFVLVSMGYLLTLSVFVLFAGTLWLGLSLLLGDSP
jgi:hypothetical protein